MPPISLFAGPLYGLCINLEKKTTRLSSILLSVFVLYTSIGCLYEQYNTSSTDTFSGKNIPFQNWHGYEVYSMITILVGFLVIVSSISWPTTCKETVEITLIIISNIDKCKYCLRVDMFRRYIQKTTNTSKRAYIVL